MFEHRRIRYLAEEGDGLHQPIKLSWKLHAILKIRAIFSSKERGVAFRRVAGYVTLEPEMDRSGLTTSQHAAPTKQSAAATRNEAVQP
jgi:hypothetical protein